MRKLNVMDGRTDRWMDRQTDGRTDRQMEDRHMDGRTDGGRFNISHPGNLVSDSTILMDFKLHRSYKRQESFILGYTVRSRHTREVSTQDRSPLS